MAPPSAFWKACYFTSVFSSVTPISSYKLYLLNINNMADIYRPSSGIIFIWLFLFFYLLATPCSMRDISSLTGIKFTYPALLAWSLNHRATREVSYMTTFMVRYLRPLCLFAGFFNTWFLTYLSLMLFT